MKLARTKHLGLEPGKLISSRCRLFKLEVAGMLEHLLFQTSDFLAQGPLGALEFGCGKGVGAGALRVTGLGDHTIDEVTDAFRHPGWGNAMRLVVGHLLGAPTSVSDMALAMESVIRSAYSKALPRMLRAARPMVWMRLR